MSKVLLDQQSPFLKSVIVNKGINHGIKNGKAVKKKSYFVGKIVNVNYLTSRILLASDLNSKIPVLIEPGRVNAILSGNGNNDYAELEYLPKVNDIKNGDGPNSYRLLMGYAGWDAGQLEQELENGDWMIMPSSEDLIFSKTEKDKWTIATSNLDINFNNLSGQSGLA